MFAWDQNHDITGFEKFRWYYLNEEDADNDDYDDDDDV